MRIAIFGNTYREVILSHIRQVVDCLRRHEVTFLFDKQLYDFADPALHLGGERVEIIDTDRFAADLALSIGGDGTFLTTASRVGDKRIPILGINLGRLGFLADVADPDIPKALEAFMRHDCLIEERTLLRVETSDGTPLDSPHALNEVAVLKQDSSSMISIDTSVNGEMVHTYMADGLLVSTPTGSTAYSMSVGGPILVPQVQGFVLSPVSSHSLNVRPLLIPDSWCIDLEVHSRNGHYLVSVDGRSRVMEQSTRLHISKADYTIHMVKQQGYTFFDTLKNKLMWGVDKRNG